MQRLLHIADRHRSASTTRWLGLVLAFNAGAVNAGGILVVGMYTSHMTGFASQVADSMVLGRGSMLLSALGALLSFLVGAACTGLLVSWARQHRLRSAFALPLLLEAALLLPFGLMGAITLNWNTPFAVPPTVLLLAFIMGLQNALGTQASGGRVRSTHMTGNITDLGIELGKLFYRNRQDLPPAAQVRADRNRMRMYGGLLSAFIGGGLFGAAGFHYVGFFWVVPLASLLLALALPPVLHDLRQHSHLHTVMVRGRERLRRLVRPRHP
ncbi:YoaK family protein [Xylophilus sp. GOD-11R]|uniref:YoaK family protein n=1 Tax=Xylophilus sp. GOD-11R TaxID=3089814 RepID=UPI00298C96B7|nr:YoaK family protein [Xylophilus sp. GOD-11R]WPB56838.1 YoaK family protein [Xylophilus sp. GOD-11R]